MAYLQRMRTMKTIVCFVCLTAMIAMVGCPPAVCNGPDPRATAINYELVSTTSSTSGTVRIIGVVTNRGTMDFVSGVGQQAVQLYQGGELVASQDFTTLAVNESVQVTYERLWSTTDEFRPPSFTVLIAYDPDIFLDGNPQNDDCNLNNNDFARGTAALDMLFPG
jgi:hypothetical protein